VVGGGATWDTTQNHVSSPGLLNQMTVLFDLLAEQGTGLLITLDEIHQRERDELRELATTVQHLFREGYEVAFVGAGLPSALSVALSDEVPTFLHRADRYHLGRVSPRGRESTRRARSSSGHVRQVPQKVRCGPKSRGAGCAYCSAPGRSTNGSRTTSTSSSNGVRSPAVAASSAASTKWLRGM